MARRVLAVGGTALVGAGLALQSNDNDGLRRTFQLWSQIGPVILHYRAYELKHKVYNKFCESLDNEFVHKLFTPPQPLTKEEEDYDWTLLHERYSQHVLDSLRDLKGFYVKVGQVLASRPDTLPKIYTEKLRTLEDEVPCQSFELVKQAIRDSLGLQSVYDKFLEIDEVPLGSASIGQVHKAKLKNGQVVAVKVQYPGIEHLFRSDIKSARTFCRVLAPEHLIIFDEIEKQFLTEFDYAREAEHLATARRNLRKFAKEAVIPQPLEWTREVLIMEYLPGGKLVDAIRKMATHVAAKRGMSYEEFEKEMIEKFEREGLPGPYNGPGPFFTEIYRKWVVTWTTAKNLLIRFYNILGWPFGFRLPLSEPWMTLNPAKVMHTLMRVHGHAMLVDGFFNGDPHAGNFLMLPDERLGFIDFGQVKRLTEQQRHQLCRVYVAVYRQDRHKLMELAKELNYKSKRFDEEVLLKMTTFSLDRDGRDVTDGLNIQQFMDKMYNQDPWESMSELLIMPVRSAFLLRGVGLLLNHPVSCAAYWGPIAEQVLKDEGIPY